MAKAFGTSLISWPSGWLALSDGGGGEAEEAGRREPRANCGARAKKEKSASKLGKMKSWIVGRDRRWRSECGLSAALKRRGTRVITANGGRSTCGGGWGRDLKV